MKECFGMSIIFLQGLTQEPLEKLTAMSTPSSSTSSSTIPPATNPPAYNMFRNTQTTTVQAMSKASPGGLQSIASLSTVGLPSNISVSTLTPVTRNSHSLFPTHNSTSTFSASALRTQHDTSSAVGVGQNTLQMPKSTLGTVHAPMTSQFMASGTAMTDHQAVSLE